MGYYKLKCGCVIKEYGDQWKWIYDCKGGWERTAAIHIEYPFDIDKKILVTKAEVAILKMLGKKDE